MGIAWLAQQPQANGTVAGEATSIATAFQVRAEALATLKQLSTAPAALADLVAQETEDSTEYIARKVGSLAPLGRDVSAPLSALVALQNPDGGFGGAPGFQSNSLDTAYALIALRAAGSSQTAVINTAIGYLTASRAADGSFGINGQSSVYITSYALQALNAFAQSYSLAAAIQSAKVWLVGQQTGGVYATVLDNAVAAIALAGATVDTSAFSGAQLALKSAQAPDGSWKNSPDLAADPYLTALVLRALVATGTAQPPATTGQIQGVVVDAAGNPLAGAFAQATGPSTRTADSDAAGAFTLDQLAPGEYIVQVTKSGLTTVSQSVVVSVGVTHDLGTIRLLAATAEAAIQGTIRDGTNNQPLADVTVAVSGRPNVSTDAAGSYQVTGIVPGTVTVTVSKAGYQMLQVTANLSAGSVLIFSPSLYPPDQTPTGATAIGKVVDGASSQGIAGATVKVGTATATTVSGGTFQLPGLVPGPVQFEVSAAGYRTSTLSGTLAAGMNDVGTIALERQATSAKVAGRVSDAATNLPIGGATVSVSQQGTTLLSISNSNGNYEIAGINQTQFTLAVSAPGYQSRNVAVSMPSLADATVNVTLDKAPTAGVSLKRVSTNLSAYDPNTAIEIEAEIQNLTTQPAPMQFRATILDAALNPVLEVPPVIATIAAEAIFEVELETHLTFQPAGNYSVLVRGYDAGGQLLVEGSASFVLNAVTRIAANVALDPPIVQAGISQPVDITASVFNHGNLLVPAGNLELTIRLDVPDTNVVPSVTATIAKIIDAPTASGLTAGVHAADGKLYLVDNSKKKIFEYVPGNPGTVTELPLPAPHSYSGTSMAADSAGHLYLLTDSNFIVKYNIANRALVSTFGTGNSFTHGFDRDSAGNFYVTGLDASGTKPGARLFRLDANGQNRTELVGPGLGDPSGIARGADGNLYVANSLTHSISKVDTAGNVTPFADAIPGARGIVVGPDGFFYVASSNSNTIVRIAPDGTKDATPWASGLSSPRELRFDAAGTLFVANSANGTVVKIPSKGVVQPFARSVANSPQGMAYDGAGNLYISAANGTVVRLDASDNATDLTTSLVAPNALAANAAGEVFIVTGLSNVVKRTTSGQFVTHASSLSSPTGIALDGAGKVYVAESGAHRISVVNTPPTAVPFVESHVTDAKDIRVAVNGDRYILNAGWLSKLPASGAGSVVNRWGTSFAGKALALEPSGGYYIQDGSTVRKYRVDHTLERTTGLSAFLAEGMALGPAGQVLVAEASSGKIRQIDAGGQVSDYHLMGAGVLAIIGDGSGGLYLLMSSTKQIRHLNASKFVSPNVITSVSGAQRIALDASGNEIYVAWTGIATGGVIAHSLAAPGSPPRTVLARTNLIALEFGNGALNVIDTGTRELATYSAQGAEQGTAVAGFSSPAGIAWNGTQLLISDSERILAVELGGYPKIYASKPLGRHLVVAGGRLYGSNNSGDLTGKVVSVTLDASKTPAERVLEVAHDVRGSTGLTGLALRPDGALAVASFSDNRIEVVSLASNPATLVASYAGMVSPTGLAIDSAGNVYVSSSSSNQRIIRIDPTGKRSSVFSPVAAAALTLDATGQLYAAERNSEIHRYDPSGNKTFVAKTSDLNADNSAFLFGGLLVTAAGEIYATDDREDILRKRAPSGSLMEPFANGLSDPKKVRVDSSGAVYIGNPSSSTIVRFAQNRLSLVGSGFGSMADIAVSSTGRVYVSSSSGELSVIDTSGLRLPLVNYVEQGGSAVGHGLAIGAGDSLAAFSGARAFRNSFVFAPGYPAAGTVFPPITKSVGAIAVGSDSATVAFGSWMPPYAGEYSLIVRHLSAGVGGTGENRLHVGPSATGQITTAKATLPPGDSSVRVNIRVTGADHTSIAKVEPSQVSNQGPSTAAVSAMGGLGADAVGNIYFSVPETRNSKFNAVVKRITPSKAIEEVWPQEDALPIKGLLPVDGDGYLYFVSGTLSKDVRRIRLPGPVTASELYRSFGERILGLTIDSGNRIVVLTPSTLYRIDRDPSKLPEVVASLTGIGTTHSLTIDGADNIYVQFGFIDASNATIIKFGRDGSRTTLVHPSSEPKFEFEGVNIAGDCATNLFMTPYSWAAIGQSGEEYSLVQMNGGTNRIAQIIDGRQVHSDLKDMDVIVYDRFSQALLIWTDHNEGNIYRVPVKCGSIDTDVHVVFPAAQPVSGLNVATKAVITRADGSREFVWNLKDLTIAGDTVSLDTTLSGLLLGDMRPVASEAFLTFRNAFAPGDFKQPLTVPTVGVDPMVDLVVTTNQVSYPANTEVVSTVRLTNRDGQQARGGELRVEVTDAQGVLVASLTQQVVSVPASGALEVLPAFNTGLLIVGSYRMIATLVDPATGKPMGSSTAGFDITTDALRLLSSVSTDKQGYEALDTATISARVKNLTLNAIVSGLQLTVVVKDPLGATVLTQTRAVGNALPGQPASLLPGALQDTFIRFPLSGRPSGTYSVSLTVSDPSVPERTTLFAVGSTADTGSGLRGTVAAPRTVNQGEPVAITVTAKNQGNAAVANVPLAIKVVNPETAQIVAQWVSNVSLAIGEEKTLTQTWSTTGVAAGTYVVMASITVGARETLLGQAPVTIVNATDTTPDAFSFTARTNVPILATITSSAVVISGINTAVPVSIAGGEYSLNGGAYTSAAATARNGDSITVRVVSSASFGTKTSAVLTVSAVSAAFEVTTITVADVSLGLSFTADTRLLVLISCKSSQGSADPLCVEQRRTFLGALLTSLGVEHRLTTDTESFKLQLRGGHYNTYWITGGAEKLQGTLADEVREATFGGASLIADGIHDDRNHLIDEAFGVTYGGRVNGVTTVLLTGSFLPPGSFAFLGEPIKADLVGGTQQAGFDTATGPAAIVTHNYGAGRGVLFAFDLVATLMAQPASTLLKATIDQSIEFSVPAVPATFTGSAEVPFTVSLTNDEPVAVEVEVVASLAGFTLASSSREPTASASGETRWSLSLAAGSTVAIDWIYTAPSASGSYTGTLTVNHLYGGVPHLVGTIPIAVEVKALESVLSQVIQELQALSLTVTAERQARDRAVTSLQQAQAAIAQAQYESALGILIDAVKELDAITSVALASQQIAIDRVMQEAGRRWYLALPACPATPACRP